MTFRLASSIYPGHRAASLELAKEVPAPVGQSLDGTVLMRVHRVLELEKRTWTNDTELRRTSHSCPLRFERPRFALNFKILNLFIRVISSML